MIQVPLKYFGTKLQLSVREQSTPIFISNFTLNLKIYLGLSINEVTEIWTAFDVHLLGSIQIKRDTFWHILQPLPFQNTYHVSFEWPFILISHCHLTGRYVMYDCVCVMSTNAVLFYLQLLATDQQSR